MPRLIIGSFTAVGFALALSACGGAGNGGSGHSSTAAITRSSSPSRTVTISSAAMQAVQACMMRRLRPGEAWDSLSRASSKFLSVDSLSGGMEMVRSVFSNYPGLSLIFYGLFLIIIMIYYPGGVAQFYAFLTERFKASRLVRLAVGNRLDSP